MAGGGGGATAVGFFPGLRLAWGICVSLVWFLVNLHSELGLFSRFGKPINRLTGIFAEHTC